MVASQYGLDILESVAIHPRQDSMGISTRKISLTRAASLTRLRRPIRFRDRRLGPPNTNPRQIILTWMDRVDRMTRIPRFPSSDRLPRNSRKINLTCITSWDGYTILTRLGVMARRSRQTRIVILTRRRRPTRC